MCVVQTITIEQFAQNVGVKIETVKRNYRKIPGISKEGDNYRVLSGTRYPFSLRGYKIDSSAEKRYVLLKAISSYKYIDSSKLRIEQVQFENMLRDLINAGLIEENGLANHFGANAYDCSELGATIAEKQRKKSISEIANHVAEAVGTLAGAVISQLV